MHSWIQQGFQPVRALFQGAKQACTKTPMRKTIAITLLVFILIIGSRFAVIAYQIVTVFRFFEPPTQTISTIKPVFIQSKPTLSAVGSVQATQGVDLHTETRGIVASIAFESGQTVTQNQLLITLKNDVEAADVANARATEHLATLNAKRAGSLYREHAISKADFDEVIAKQAQAKAAAQKAQALLEQKNIRAPFAGKVGIRKINVGQYIDPTTSLVELQMMDPLYISFNLPEQSLTQLFVGQSVIIQSDHIAHPINGKINAINATINEQSRNISAQAIVKNTDKSLYPGMFANVKLLLAKQPRVMVLPQTAIDFNAYGESVFVLYPDKNKKGELVQRVKRKNIKTGETINNSVVITEGLKPDDIVVSSGQLKLDDGTAVNVNNAIAVDSPNKPNTLQ